VDNPLDSVLVTNTVPNYTEMSMFYIFGTSTEYNPGYARDIDGFLNIHPLKRFLE
jgi:hypothetical protein